MGETHTHHSRLDHAARRVVPCTCSPAQFIQHARALGWDSTNTPNRQQKRTGQARVAGGVRPLLRRQESVAYEPTTGVGPRRVATMSSKHRSSVHRISNTPCMERRSSLERYKNGEQAYIPCTTQRR
ncbi:unnamed protein product, partial [Trichogramma brassicae]